ncbi:MAG: FCD domain-containing protein [Actinobacteria bacterium]|nr:FCD domain-containing protein [Actinomycetota bacterium]MQB00180.1 FCD domain-containing protein [Actinomycetota bacterium]
MTTTPKEWKSLRDRIYKIVKEMILRGEMAPGQQLTFAMLSEQLGVSTTPLREALATLTTEGLVVRVPYRGVRVASLTPDFVCNVYDVRKALEWLSWGEVAQYVKANPESIDLDIPRELLKQGRDCLAHGDLKRYSETDLELHLSVARLSGNTELASMMVGLIDKFRWLMTHTVQIEGRARHSCVEHERLVEAAAAGEANRARELIIAHIDDARDQMLDVKRGDMRSNDEHHRGDPADHRRDSPHTAAGGRRYRGGSI